MEQYANKRTRVRGTGGKFRRVTFSDMGVSGVCPVCHHLLVRYYDGDPKKKPIDHRLFRARCYTCEPMTNTEKAIAEEQLKADQLHTKTFFDSLGKME